MTKIFFTVDRHDCYLSRIFPIRIGANLKQHLLAGRLFEKAVDVVRGVHFTAIHGEDVVAGFDIDSGLRERRLRAWIPVLTVVHLGNAVAAVLESVIRAEQATLYFLRLRGLTSTAEHVSHFHFADPFLT